MGAFRSTHAAFSSSLELAVESAQRQLAEEWARIVAAHESLTARQSALRAAYARIVEEHGIAVAVDAAALVEIGRAGHPTLGRLEPPTPARPAQMSAVAKVFAEASRGWSEPDHLPPGLTNMLTTLVMQPARNTVMMATKQAGTEFVLVPNTRACAWCLMRAGSGARQRKIGDGGDFHPGCECWVSESVPDRPDTIPAITREVLALAQDGRLEGAAGDLRTWERARKKSIRRLSDFRAFPSVPGVEIPELQLSSFVDDRGSLLPMPIVDNVFGHVLFGWRNETPLLDMLRYERKGHTADSLAPQSKSRFPAHWSDQDIVDAIVAGLESTSAWGVRAPGRVRGRKRVYKDMLYAGVLLRLQYYIGADGGGENITAFPIDVEGVM